MKTKEYKCTNCELEFELDHPSQDDEANCCPHCGHLLPGAILYIKNYFRIILLNKELEKAKELLLKSEFQSAVREAFIQFENQVRIKSGQKDLFGYNLMAEAFTFKYDQKTKEIIEYPKISINDLSDVTKRNEQEGVKFMAMGLMQGIRNVYMHTEGMRLLYYTLQIITTVDMLLRQIHHSNNFLHVTE